MFAADMRHETVSYNVTNIIQDVQINAHTETLKNMSITILQSLHTIDRGLFSALVE